MQKKSVHSQHKQGKTDIEIFILTHHANSAARAHNIPLYMEKPKALQNAEHTIIYDMGDMTHICHDCSVKHFVTEKSRDHHQSCCQNGKVTFLPVWCRTVLKTLLIRQHSLSNIP